MNPCSLDFASKDSQFFYSFIVPFGIPVYLLSVKVEGVHLKQTDYATTGRSKGVACKTVYILVCMAPWHILHMYTFLVLLFCSVSSVSSCSTVKFGTQFV